MAFIPRGEQLSDQAEGHRGQPDGVAGEGGGDQEEGQPVPGPGDGGEEGEVERQAAHGDGEDQAGHQQENSPACLVHQAERHWKRIV